MFLGRSKSTHFFQFSVPFWHVFYLPHILHFIDAIVLLNLLSVVQLMLFVLVIRFLSRPL
jgi:hypothetical protein